MERLEELVSALTRRVEALEQENGRLRRAASSAAAGGVNSVTSRRSLLAGGAGLIGVLAGAEFLEHVTAAGAAPAIAPSAGTVHSLEVRNPVITALQAVVPVQHSGGNHWARVEWDLSTHFRGARPPVVVASSVDDFHGAAAGAVPTCAVSVERVENRFLAVIMLGNLSHLAKDATVNAIAFGE